MSLNIRFPLFLGVHRLEKLPEIRDSFNPDAPLFSYLIKLTAVLTQLYNGKKIKTLFDNVGDMGKFSEDLEGFLSDRLSYYDLAVYKDKNEEKARERVYHVFMLGLLSAYDDIQYRRPQSNRESGDGRYDILAEKSNHYFIFEFKSSKEGDDLEERAEEALAQIESKRYGADLSKDKPLIKIGVAFYGKRCKVKCA